jgi:hypothetical protein
MKFKTPIEVQAGISDGDPTNPLGQAGYLLSSDGSNVNWVSPGGLSAETAEAIVQPIKANEALAKGDPLYIVGYQSGQNVNIVAKADSSDVAKMPVVGLADDDYANQAFGTMTAFGSFNGSFDTTGGTENWAIGDIIFVKAGGGLTNVKPGGTDLIQNIAIVSRVQQNTGELEVIALGRTNDVPNLPEGRLFVGTSNNTSLASDVIYVDDTSDRVGIGTANPSTDLEVSSTGVNGVDISQSASNASQSGRLFFTTNTASEGFALFNSNGTFQVNSGGIPNNTSGTNRISIIGSSGNVGIGQTVPFAKLHITDNTSNTYAKIRLQGSNRGGIIEMYNGSSFPVSSWTTDQSGNTYFATSGAFENISTSTKLTILTAGNVGIGTTNPGSKLEVDGEIDASGGDGYRINGKPWAEENSNDLKLGDWDGEGFSTSIYDDNSNPTVIVKDFGAMINCSSLTSSYGATASLAVGLGAGADAAVLTLSNTDANPSSAGDATGIIQFAIKDDQSGLGYTSASIQGSISQAAGSGNGGGGILDFYTAPYGTGNSPQLRMRINDSGDVGIGTTSPGSILHLEDTNPTLKILSNQYYGNSLINMGNGGSEAGFITCFNNPGISSLELRYDNGSTGDSAIRVGQRYLEFRIDGGTAMYINSSKNVGIGTTNPGTYKLAVDGSTAIGENLQVSDGLGGDRTLDIDAPSGAFRIGDIDGIADEAYIEGDGENIRISNGGGLTLIADSGQNVGIGNANPQSRLQVNGGVQLSNDTASPSAFKVGTFRYRTSGNNSYVDMCMQTGASTYTWVNIVTNSW